MRGKLPRSITKDVEETGLFRWHGVETILKDHLDRRANWGYQLWSLMTLLLWGQKWNARNPIIVLVAAAIFLACIYSPPKLMDELDAALGWAV
jgi:hypothetical protein